jgi:hypothetical protein
MTEATTHTPLLPRSVPSVPTEVVVAQSWVPDPARSKTELQPPGRRKVASIGR